MNRSREEMLALAERCEQATGHDLDLDHAIGRALSTNGNYSYRPYTASLDAAMTLMPEGWNVGLFIRHDWPKHNAQVWHGQREANTRHGDAATPALALCAAALRTLARENDGG